jgi:phosphatidylinositol alpha-1,6-mannosyltransferase
MHITFLTRKYPPAKGGMETFSYELGRAYTDSRTIINHGQKQRDIVWAIPRLLFDGWRLRKKTDVYHLGDLVLAPLAPLLKLLTRKPVVVTVHALELTFDNPMLRFAINRSLWAMTHFVCVSQFTAGLLRDRGVSQKRMSVIGHGIIPPQSLERSTARTDLFAELGATDTGRPLLVTVGRLVKRKGVAWCIEHVIPRLRDLNPLYIVTSSGPDQERIEQLIEQHDLGDIVILAGKVSEDALLNAYASTDIFLMPNIPVEHDAEGFGFVAIEAASYGAPVLASRLEGIPDAIHDGKNGRLVEPENADTYERMIREWLDDDTERHAFGEQARAYTLSTFRWESVAQQYQQVFTNAMN